LIDKLEEEDIGLLLLIDFEKAFDTVEWSFLNFFLQFYGFEPSLQKWIKAFYWDISSAVTSYGYAMRSHQHIDLINTQNHLILSLLFLGRF
jgi:hypothetical protein